MKLEAKCVSKYCHISKYTKPLAFKFCKPIFFQPCHASDSYI